MEINTAFDIGNIIVIIISILAVILAGWMSENTRLSDNRALQASFVSMFLVSFLFSNLVFDTEQMRLVVGIIFITFIFPFSINFITVWTTVRRPSIVRIQYVTIISWIISLIFTMVLRALFGWGFPTSSFGYIIFSLVASVANGFFGALIAHTILNKMEKYRPSRNQLQPE
jgi:hypothetical protein